jgi:hypothetical protein
VEPEEPEEPEDEEKGWSDDHVSPSDEDSDYGVDWARDTA